MSYRQSSTYTPSSPRGGSCRYSSASTATSFASPLTPIKVSFGQSPSSPFREADEMDEMLDNLTRALNMSAKPMHPLSYGYTSPVAGPSSYSQMDYNVRLDTSPVLPSSSAFGLPKVSQMSIPHLRISRMANHSRSQSAEEPRAMRPVIHVRTASAPGGLNRLEEVRKGFVYDAVVEELEIDQTGYPAPPSETSSIRSISSSSSQRSTPPVIPVRVTSKNSIRRAPPHLPPSRASSLKSSSSTISLATLGTSGQASASASTVSLASTVLTTHPEESGPPVASSSSRSNREQPVLPTGSSSLSRKAAFAFSPFDLSGVPLRRVQSAPFLRSSITIMAPHVSSLRDHTFRAGLRSRRASSSNSTATSPRRRLVHMLLPSRLLDLTPSPLAIEHKAEARSCLKQESEQKIPVHTEPPVSLLEVRTSSNVDKPRYGRAEDLLAECKREDARRARTRQIELENAAQKETSHEDEEDIGAAIFEAEMWTWAQPPAREVRAVRFVDEKALSVPSNVASLARAAPIRTPSSSTMSPSVSISGMSDYSHDSHSTESTPSTMIMTPTTSATLLPAAKIYERPLPPTPSPSSLKTPTRAIFDLQSDTTPRPAPRQTIPNSLLPSSRPSLRPSDSFSSSPSSSTSRLPPSYSGRSDSSDSVKRLQADLEGGKKEKGWLGSLGRGSKGSAPVLDAVSEKSKVKSDKQKEKEREKELVKKEKEKRKLFNSHLFLHDVAYFA